MVCSTQEERALAESLGFTYSHTDTSSCRFTKRSKNYTREVYPTIRNLDTMTVYWLTVDLMGGKYTNRKIFNELSEALERPLTPKEPT